MYFKLETIHTQDPQAFTLDNWKAFASISESGHDGMLMGILRSAFVKVGDWHDVSLLEQTLRLTVEDYDGKGVTLYRTPDTVISVKDGNGNALPYTRNGRKVEVHASGTVVIEYSTRAMCGEADDMRTKAFRYALAVYDGEDSTVLNNILMER